MRHFSVMLPTGQIRHHKNSRYVADLRSLVSFSSERTTMNLHNHFRKHRRCSKYDRSALVMLPVFSSDTVHKPNFIFPLPCGDAICRQPPGIKGFREGWDLYNKQLCLYFRMDALLVMINLVVGCNIASVTEGSWRNWYPFVSGPLYWIVSLCQILVWRMWCAISSTQSAGRYCTAVRRTSGVYFWSYYVRKLSNGVSFTYKF
jgi:hypothetical protein